MNVQLRYYRRSILVNGAAMDNEEWIMLIENYKEEHGLTTTSLAKQLNEHFQVLYRALSRDAPVSFRLKLRLRDKIGFDDTRDLLTSVLPDDATDFIKTHLIEINKRHIKSQLTPIPDEFIHVLETQGVDAAWREILNLALNNAGSAGKLSKKIGVTPQTLNRMRRLDLPFGMPLKLKLIDHLKLEIDDNVLFALLSQRQTDDINTVFPDLYN